MDPGGRIRFYLQSRPVPCQIGGIDEDEMYKTFNMGIGMIVAVADSDLAEIKRANPEVSVIGNVIEGKWVKYKSTSFSLLVDE